MGSLLLERYHFDFLTILTETLTFLSLLNPVLQYLITQLFLCHTLYITISLRRYVTISLYHYITTSLYHYITTSLYHYITISLYRYITTLLYHYIAISLHCYITISLYQYIMFKGKDLVHQFLVGRVQPISDHDLSITTSYQNITMGAINPGTAPIHG